MNISKLLFGISKALDENDRNILIKLFNLLVNEKININDISKYFTIDEIKNIFDLLDENNDLFNNNFKYALNLIIEKMLNENYFIFVDILRDILGYPINDSYLMFLIDEISLNEKNDYLDSLINILSDRNYLINNIGTKINICKFLRKNNFKDLKVLKVKNSYLSDTFSFLSFKNDKNKYNRNKLYFRNDLIIVNCLDSDRNFSYVIYRYDNININDIMNSYINENIKNIDVKNIDVKSKQYTYIDREEKMLQFVSDLINVLKYFNNDYNDLDLIPSDLNDNNLFEYIQILKRNYQIFYRYDKLNYKFEYILNFLISDSDFKSNDLDLLPNDLDSYDTFNYSNKEKRLFDTKYRKETIKSKYEKINRLLDL